MLEILNILTMPILASASPRNPRVVISCRSFSCRNLLVAWRSRANDMSSGCMPFPSSVMRIVSNPPFSISIFIDFDSASRLFSSNSFTTCAGLSTTSPAAMKPMVLSSSCLILFASVKIITLDESFQFV